MLNTKHIQELIKTGEIDQIKDAIEQSLAPGSRTFEQVLFELYSAGRITLEEAMSNADSPTNLHWLINNAGKPVAVPAYTAAARRRAPAQGSGTKDDLSSIKLNLDALD
jgi:twitching motility protein PilU